MMLRCSGDDDVGKSWCVAFAARPIRHRPGNPRCRRVESKNTIAVEVQNCLQPRGQISTLARRTFTPQFCDSILDFRNRHSRQE